MKLKNNYKLSTSPTTQFVIKSCKVVSIYYRQRHLYGNLRRNNTGKELDPETGLYYYGARYMDPKASRWLSGDPALGEYLPSAPVNEEARKRNGNLPGMGGVFNYVNLHVYHYAGNNPVKYVDPDGRAAGQEFDNITAAIRDFAMIYNFDSIRAKAEYGTVIYKDNVTNKYVYLEPIREDNNAEVNILVVRTSDRFIPVAAIHTHGGYEANENTPELQIYRSIPSDKDKAFTREQNIPLYTCTPAGIVTELLPYQDRANILSYIRGIPMDPYNLVNNYGISYNRIDIYSRAAFAPYYDITGKLIR